MSAPKSRSASSSVEELRREFDRAFAQPRTTGEASGEDLLTLRIAGVAYALSFREVLGLLPCGKLTRVPGQAATMLGLAGVRGAIVPVHSLARLLGHSIAEAPRWLVLCAAPHAAGETIGLAFEQFEGHLRVRSEELREAASEPVAGEPRAHLTRVLRDLRQRGDARAVPSIRSLLGSIAGKIV